MKFLCDVHIPYRLVIFLKKKGCEAFHVNELFSDPRTKDSVIVEYADANDCIAVTKNADFKESYLLYRKPAKLIKLNTGNSSTAQIINLSERNWQVLVAISSRRTFYFESDLINFFLIEIEP